MSETRQRVHRARSGRSGLFEGSGQGNKRFKRTAKVMLLTGAQMLALIPRYALLRLLAVGAVALAVIASMAPAAHAKKDPEVKRIKKELVAIQDAVDEQAAALDRFGERWDELEEQDSKKARDFDSFISFTLGGAEQAQIETLIMHVRAALDALEEHQDETIGELEKIVVERQQKKLEKSGVSAATMPSISVSGSLVTYSADWEKTAMCESTQRWHIDSRYDGGLQFDPITWIEFGGAEFARYAWQATKLEQIAVSERVLAIQGPHAWPNCFTPLQADT